MKAMKTYLYEWGIYIWQKVLGLALALVVWLVSQPGAAASARRMLAMEKRYRIDIGRPDRITILLVGCGGTGSYAAHVLAQLAHQAKEQGLDMRLVFIDPDRVEPKNLARQNFCPAEVGYPKALTLAWRYSAAFGLGITPVVERFRPEMLREYRPLPSPQGGLMIVVGAVDNAAARREIADALTGAIEAERGRQRYWWIDAGNERWHGQVLAGNSLAREAELSPLGYCIGTPLPHLQEPSLLQERARPAGAEGLSCAELTLLGEQSAVINRAMAGWIGVYLFRLVQSRDLDLMATWVNLHTGLVRSRPVTGGRVAVPRRSPAGAEAEAGGCPACGARMVAGLDELEGVVVGVRFCTVCDWRIYTCPNPDCEGELEETGFSQDERGEPVPALVCDRCGWQAFFEEAAG